MNRKGSKSRSVPKSSKTNNLGKIKQKKNPIRKTVDARKPSKSSKQDKIQEENHEVKYLINYFN
jgi:hypothetical protein